jgi:hypothetical protein
VKWGLIAAAAGAVAAVLAGALIFTLGSRESSTYQVITTTATDSSPVGLVQQVTTASPVRQRTPSAPACQSNNGDNSDPTGSDSSGVRRTRTCPANGQSAGAQDNQAGDSNSDQSGDNQAGDRGGDNQAGDNQAGDRGSDNQAGDNATSEP